MVGVSGFEPNHCYRLEADLTCSAQVVACPRFAPTRLGVGPPYVNPDHCVLSAREHAGLSAVARKYDVSLSWLIRKAITQFLNQYGTEGGKPALKLPLRETDLDRP
jgi:hypothetical protein